MKHTALLDFAKLGFNCRANIMLRTNREQRDKLGSHLKAHPSINNLYKINNGYDFIAEGIFTHVKDLEDFIDELEPSFDTLIKLNKTFIDRDHLKKWVKGMQPYYKNHIPEVYNYFLNKTQL